MALQARGDGAALDLRGPLADNGGYLLRGSGSVGISRTKVPVTGFLRATAPGRSASTTWRVSGSTPRVVRTPGARLDGVRLELSSSRRVPHGTASLRLDEPLLTAPAIVEVAGADTWSAQDNGSNRRLWVMPKTDQVVVRTGELTGAVGMRAGRPHWTLTAPGAARIGTLDYNVDVGFAGRLTYTVQARAAVGTFLGMPGDHRRPHRRHARGDPARPADRVARHDRLCPAPGAGEGLDLHAAHLPRPERRQGHHAPDRACVADGWSTTRCLGRHGRVRDDHPRARLL